MQAKKYFLFSLIFLVFFTFLQSETLWERFVEGKTLEEAFLYIKEKIELEDTTGIALSPALVLQSGKANILEKYYLLAQFLKSKKLYFRWRHLLLKKGSQVEKYFSQLQSGYGSRNYYILEVMYGGSWKPVDLFWGNSFFDFRYVGEPKEFYFQLPESKFFYHLNLKVSVLYKKYLRDYLQLENKEEKYEVIYSRNLKLANCHNDFLKIAFFPSLLKDKTLVAVIDKDAIKIREYDNLDRVLVFDQKIERKISQLQISYELDPPDWFKKTSLSESFTYEVSKDKSSSYGFYFMPFESERNEVLLPNVASPLEKELESLETLAIGVVASDKITSFLKKLLFHFRFREYALVSSVFNKMKKYSWDITYLPLITEEKEGASSTKVVSNLHICNPFFPLPKEKNYYFSLWKALFYLQNKVDFKGQIIFIQDLLEKKFPLPWMEKLLEGYLIYAFKDKALFLNLKNFNWRLIGKDKKFSRKWYEFSILPFKFKLPVLRLWYLFYTGKGNLSLSVDNTIDSKLRDFILWLKEKLMYKFLQIKTLERKYSTFYQQQRYGEINSLLPQPTSYNWGDEVEYLQNLLKFYKSIYKNEGGETE